LRHAWTCESKNVSSKSQFYPQTRYLYGS
jgi:hypothetical protein